MTDCLTNRRTDCEGMTNRKPRNRLFSDLLSLPQEVRPPPFHIAHWTAQHPVGEDDIMMVMVVKRSLVSGPKSIEDNDDNKNDDGHDELDHREVDDCGDFHCLF